MQKGMTLTELVIALAVAAILAAMAWPVYQRQVHRTHRAEAIEALLREAGRQERMYFSTNAFSPRTDFETDSGRYRIHADVGVNGRQYRLKAIPQGAQVKDPCGILEVNHIGDRGSGGDVQTCWHGR